MPERKPNSRNTPNPLRTLAAVYIIMAPDGRRYIGSSTRVARRWCDHRSKLKHRRHENAELQACADLHGVDSLCFELLQRTAPENLERCEQEWLNIYLGLSPESLLNRSPTAGKANTGITRTEVVRAARRGEGNANARLSASDVARIRSVLVESAGIWGIKSKLAREHGVCTATISKIERGQRWAV